MIQAPGLVSPKDIPPYVGKCQIIELMGWTEREYEEDNSLLFIAELSTYLEGKTRGLNQLRRRNK